MAPSARLVGIELKGIAGSKQRRLALINNATFAAGESGNIKVGSQSILITCLQVEDDSVMISLGEATGMARLKLGSAAEPMSAPRQTTDGQPNAATIQSQNDIPPHPVPAPILPNQQQGGATKRESTTLSSSIEGMVAGAAAKMRVISMRVILIAGGVLAVSVVCWTIARRNKRDAESLRKLYGRRSAHATAGSHACPRPDELQKWFQQHGSPSPGSESTTAAPGNAVIPVPHSAVAEPRQSVPIAAAISIDELIQRIRHLDWFQFEKIIGVIYGQLGYAVSRRGGANPDGGIDLVIARDGESIAVQCKHWKTSEIKLRTVREFLGALTDSKIRKGFIVTLAGHTADARKLADKHGIAFVNETPLRDMLGRIGATANSEVHDILNDTRKFCPKCEAEMILRTSGSGRDAGGQFWGCSTYPKCRYTMPLEQAAA